MSIRIKFCGISNIEDAVVAAAQGVDAIGLVFYPQSLRHVSIKTAQEIIASLPPFVSVVGLFVDQDSNFIKSVLEQVNLDCLQFHGQETAEFCDQFAKPYYKALCVRSGMDIVAEAGKYPNACAILLDNYQVGLAGGSGQSFDWDLIPKNLNQKIILAGGLTEKNVVSAIRRVNPYAVDVSSGIESSPGVKDLAKMQAFVQEVARIHD